MVSFVAFLALLEKKTAEHDKTVYSVTLELINAVTQNTVKYDITAFLTKPFTLPFHMCQHNGV